MHGIQTLALAAVDRRSCDRGGTPEGPHAYAPWRSAAVGWPFPSRPSSPISTHLTPRPKPNPALPSEQPRVPRPPSEDPTTPWWKSPVLLRRTVSVLCLAATAWWLTSQPTPKIPTNPEALAFLGAASLLTLGTAMVRGYRWKAILRAVDLRPSGWDPYLLAMVGYMGNTVLPARGGDVLRIGLLSRRRKFDWKSVAGTLIPERLLDVIALAIVLLGLSFSGTARSELGAWPAALAGGGMALIAAGLIAYHALRVRGYLQALADRVRPFTRPTRVLMSPRGAQLLTVSTLLWAAEALVLWLVAEAIDTDLHYVGAMFVVVLASFVTAVPAAPGFVGTFDAAVIFGLRAAGVPPEETLALALLYRAVLFLPTTLVGAIVLLVRYGGLSQLHEKFGRGEASAAADSSAEAETT